MSRSVAFVALVPHPPILISEIGCGREREAAETLAAYSHLREQLAASRAERILLISSHGVITLRRFHILTAEPAGTLSRFGADLRFQFAGDPEFARAALDAAGEVPLAPAPFWEEGDHSAWVPLHLLDAAALDLPLAIAGVSFLPARDHFELGRLLRRTIDASGKRTAVIASGDGAHTLTQESPSGFHPQAREFQDAVDRAISEWDAEAAFGFNDELRQAVDESVVSPLAVLMGLLDGDAVEPRVLSAEAPWGVAYTAAEIALEPAD